MMGGHCHEGLVLHMRDALEEDGHVVVGDEQKRRLINDSIPIHLHFMQCA